MSFPSLRLKKNEDRRIRGGHLWIYSNEIDVDKTPLTSFTPGGLVSVENASGKVVGTAYVNPHSLLCARLISTHPNQPLDENFFLERLTSALQLRDMIFKSPYYRLAFGESDGLPGLVIDRFADILCVQIGTAGIENAKAPLVSALVKLLNPRAILLRNDSSIRAMENLPFIVEPLLGDPPQEVTLEENNVRFTVPLWKGQKTGWFYDHRYNRAQATHYVVGKRVLDMFSYVGGWGIPMAVAGAKEVICVDSSAFALGYLQQNAALNHVAEKVKTHEGEAFDTLNEFRKTGEKFDVIILDPPAFIKRRKDIREGLQAYFRANELALRLLSPQGILVSASCSFHLSRENLIDIIRATSVRVGCQTQILEQGYQAPDHPIHPAMPETNYLKSFIVRMI